MDSTIQERKVSKTYIEPAWLFICQWEPQKSRRGPSLPSPRWGPLLSSTSSSSPFSFLLFRLFFFPSRRCLSFWTQKPLLPSRRQSEGPPAMLASGSLLWQCINHQRDSSTSLKTHNLSHLNLPGLLFCWICCGVLTHVNVWSETYIDIQKGC